MSALICGSLAYDTIMVFPGRFKEHILPEKVHILNVSFMVPQIRREFGGCAGNIAYNLHLLGGDGQIMATAGQDFEPYAEWIEQCGLSQRYIKKIGHEYTAQAFVTTDLDDNQITAFHSGAMNNSHENDVPRDGDISIAIISPDGKEGMLQHAFLAVRRDDRNTDVPVAGHIVFMRVVHGTRVERGDLVVVEVRGDERLRGVFMPDLLDVALAQAALLDPFGVGFEILPRCGHDLAITAQQVQVVGDIAGASPEFTANLRHHEGDIQDVHFFRQDVLLESTRKYHDGIVSQRTADQG